MDNLSKKKGAIYTILIIIMLGVLGFILYRILAPTQELPPIEPRGIIGRISNILGLGTGKGVPEEDITKGMEPEERPREGIEEKLLQLTDFPVVSVSLNRTEDKILFYKKDGGDLFAYNFNGAIKEKISNLTVVGIIEAFWSPVKDRALVMYLDDETKKGFLHQGTSTITTLPQNIKSATWSPDGKALAYLILQNDLLGLVLSDSSGKNPKTIFTTPIQDVQTTWITKDLFAFTTAPSGFAEGFIFTLNRNSGIFKKILGPFFGLTSLWSQDGSRLITSLTDNDGKNIIMNVWDNSGKMLFGVGIKTLAEKCVFVNQDEIYCAVPSEITDSRVLPDEYLSGEFNSLDKLLYINLKNKETRELFNEGWFDMSNLVITKNQEYIFFVNRFDGTLWRIKLK